jgi:hypothetical protein
MRNIDGAERAHVFFVEAEKLPARGQIVIDYVEHLSVNSLLYRRESDCVRTIVHVRKWDFVGTTQMQKDAKCSYAHPARNPWITGAKDIARADDDVWHTKPLRIFSQDLILLHFYERVGVSAQLGMPIDGAILIKHSSFRLVPVTVDRK